jgi:hypothetical protein
MIPSTMPATLADVIRRHGGEWLTWELAKDNEGCIEYASRELQFTATFGMARSSPKAFVLIVSNVSGWNWEFDPDSIEDYPSLEQEFCKPLYLELSDLAAMNRPSMCSEVSRRLLALSAREREGS